MLELLLKGGPALWLILGISLAGAAVFLERLFNLHRAQIKTGDFLNGIYNILRKNNAVEAISICEETPGPVSRIVRAAILHAGEPPESIRLSIEETGLAEIPRLEKNLGLLATVAQIAPLLGLLGTALGMMQILWVLQAKAPLVHAGDLMSGLWSALVATAAGLVVAVLAYAGYNFLVARVESIVLDMDRSASEILSFMVNRPSQDPSP